MLTTPLDQATWIVIDTETTGIEVASDRVVEVACTQMTGRDPNTVTPLVDQLVNPERDIPPTASAVHHLVAADVADAPTLDVVWHQTIAPVLPDHTILVAHNAPFDAAFLAPYPGERPWLDTLRLARHLWPEAPKHSNQVLRYWLGLELPPLSAPPHRALPDTVVTAVLLATALQHLATVAPAVATVGDLLAWVARPLTVTVMPFGKHKGTPLHEVPRDYFQWLLKQWAEDDSHADPDLKASILAVLEASAPRPAGLGTRR